MSTTSAVPIADSAMINVVGQEAPYPYGKVKDAVLLLGKEFYFKHDTANLVRVKDPSGKKKYFRKKSKLVFEISPGKFIHRSFLVKTEDGIFLDKTDPDTVIVDGKLTRRDFAVEVNGKLYLRTSPLLQTCAISSTSGLKSEMIKLHDKYYNDMWVLPNTPNLIKCDGGLIMAHDSRKLLTANGEVINVHFTELGSIITDIFYQFRDVTNPQLNRIDYIAMRSADKKGNIEIHPDTGIKVHKKHYAEFVRIYNDVILLHRAAETEAIKNALKYADDGPDENQAKAVVKIPEPWPGKYNVFTPKDMSPTFSKSCSMLGGLKYTFGLEIETAQGLVPNEMANALKMRIVGDRSIGAGEYVSGILHGNEGLELLKMQCDTISKHCFVDDKCGLHVHVGGMEGMRGVASADFDRRFAQYAISLGTQIEKELFETCPLSRYPTMKHCHSIMRWKDINDENWREYLGAFVFGNLETWAEPWSFGNFSYGTGGRNKRNKLGDYCGGRYKWLNLVHILSRSNINTCEFRLFPGTTSFEKVFSYVMLSMAFVWFVENKVNRIVKGDVTLNEVLEAPFARHPEIALNLISFFEARKKKFNRTNLYPKVIPKAIF